MDLSVFRAFISLRALFLSHKEFYLKISFHMFLTSITGHNPTQHFNISGTCLCSLVLDFM